MAIQFGQLCDEIFALQAQVDKIEEAAAAKTKPLKQQIADKEQYLQLAIEDANLTGVEGKKSKAVIEERLCVSFADMDAFAAFAIRRKALHLFERRISTKAYREMKELLGNKPIPGLSEFTKKTIKIRKA